MSQVGRGDGDFEGRDELRSKAAHYYNLERGLRLLEQPQLTDHVEDALSQSGHSCEQSRGAPHSLVEIA